MWIYAVFNRVLFDFFIQSVNLAGEVFFYGENLHMSSYAY